MNAEDILLQVESVLGAKTQDYGGKHGDRLFNFRFIATVLRLAAGEGLGTDHVPYLALLSVKVARLITLLGHGGSPKNEPVEDTIKDLIGYVALWGEHITGGKEQE